MIKVVPLLVTIGLDHRGRHEYPPFNTLPAGMRGNCDWCTFIDRHGGWLYDRKSGHRNDDPESPFGMWRGMVLVPEQFATESVERWPDQCEILDDTEAATFYETRARHGAKEREYDLEALQLIAAKRAVGLPEDDDDREALDPNSDTPGVRTNKLRKWTNYKQSVFVDIDADSVDRVKQKQAEVRARRDRG